MHANRRVAISPRFDVSRIPNQSVATLVNMYAEQAGGKGDFPVTGYPGRAVALAELAAPDRGIYCTARGRIYGVAGDRLYRLDASMAVEYLGTVPGTDRVEWAENRTQIAICADGWVYVYDESSQTYTGALTAEAFLGATSIACVGGWGIYTSPDSDQFYISAINDFRTIQSLDFATAESRADVTKAVRIVSNELWFLGTDSTEQWHAAGSGVFPFARAGVNQDVGCVARDTALNFNQGLMWLGKAGQSQGLCVYRNAGYVPQRVSTHPVERLLERAGADISRARAMAWAVDGHAFYALTCVAGTVVFDAVTGEWHQAAGGAWPLTQSPPPSDWSSSVYIDGRSLVADTLGRLGYLTFAASDDLGTPMVRELVGAQMGAVGTRASLMLMELELEAGKGGLTLDPAVIMSLSRDGGHTWDLPRTATAGKTGDYRKRVMWRPNSQSREFVARFRMADAAPFNITGALAYVKEVSRP